MTLFFPECTGPLRTKWLHSSRCVSIASVRARCCDWPNHFAEPGIRCFLELASSKRKLPLLQIDSHPHVATAVRPWSCSKQLQSGILCYVEWALKSHDHENPSLSDCTLTFRRRGPWAVDSPQSRSERQQDCRWRGFHHATRDYEGAGM